MKVKIITFGKTKHQFLSDAEEFYLQRIKPFTTLEIVNLPEEKMGKTITIEQIQESEAQKALKHISGDDYVIACDPHGKQFTSPDFARQMKQIANHAPSVVFCIGGSEGLGKTFLKKCHQKISFSAMTFPHDLFRVFLLEQIYRGFMIINNRQYHR